MKLSEKGSFAPRPALHPAAEAVASAVERWPSVHARTHWELGDESVVDGADFYVGERELGHLHLYPEAHVALPRTLCDQLIAAKLARPFRWNEAFIVHRTKTTADTEAVLWLFGLAYDHLAGVGLATLRARIAARTPTRIAG